MNNQAKAPMKVEAKEIAQPSEFEKAQKAVVEIGYKIREHQHYLKNISNLVSMDVSEKGSDYQYITLQDAERNDFRIKEPVLIKEVIQFLITRCQAQAKRLEGEILESTRVTIAKAA